MLIKFGELGRTSHSPCGLWLAYPTPGRLHATTVPLPLHRVTLNTSSAFPNLSRVRSGVVAIGAKLLRQFDAAERVDVVIGSSSVPVAASQGAIATEAKLPFIALCPIRLDPQKQPYVFSVPQPVPLMVEGVVAHMRAAGIKSVGFIGFTDAWGDLTYKAMTDAAGAAGITH